MKAKIFIARIWISISILATISTGFASVPDITGTYQCAGNDPTLKPSEFTGKVMIFKHGSAYLIQEADTDSNTNTLTYQEIAILSGDILSVAYQELDTRAFGIQTYTVSKQGKKLDGYFIYWNKFDQKGTQTCEKIIDVSYAKKS